VQAIVTKYLPPTNFRGARIKAKAEAGEVIVPWDYGLNVDENHRKAATVLLFKLDWNGRWFGGVLPSEEFVWVCGERRNSVREVKYGN